MTKAELVALSQRIHERIERNGIPSRPITDAQKARFDELKRQHEESTQ